MVDQGSSEVMRKALAAEAAGRAAAEALRDPDAIQAAEASELYRVLDQAERAAAAGKALAARHVAESKVWRDQGFASAPDFMASVSGKSVGAAKDELAISDALVALPATRDALIDGSLSTAQGRVIVDAAKVNPVAEGDLLRAAEKSTLKDLKNEGLRAKARAADFEATQERIARERRCSSYVDGESAWNLHARSTGVDGSVIDAELDVITDQHFRAKAKAGSFEAREAYRMDALLEMARNSQAFRLGAGTSTGKRKQAPPTHLALLRADISALQRGQVDGDELCEIAGVGPISIEQARRILPEAVLKIIVTKGEDVANVTSIRRGPDQAMHYALLWSSPECVAEGCNRTIIEYDHRSGTEYVVTRHTKLDELDPVCGSHHDLHTHHGWAFVLGTGKRPMVPPEDPRHPFYRPPPDDPDEELRTVLLATAAAIRAERAAVPHSWDQTCL
jgi:hypothetical protein